MGIDLMEVFGGFLKVSEHLEARIILKIENVH